MIKQNPFLQSAANAKRCGPAKGTEKIEAYTDDEAVAIYFAETLRELND